MMIDVQERDHFATDRGEQQSGKVQQLEQASKRLALATRPGQ